MWYIGVAAVTEVAKNKLLLKILTPLVDKDFVSSQWQIYIEIVNSGRAMKPDAKITDLLGDATIVTNTDVIG
ncbi:hypothetical protein H6G41_16895 [Tolypothrix sp. FACHB-123]|uniref:hypothetical protein n=1 Tax=Tolypothrix sp. FACHB-123 TaxID=2692868 RepID=UPI00168346B1|nr:hypothetical protein [Tolypothrix sp. FACHB-123]MBD2356286.1 hypothetical protein [Tolypothrix sp. FACHB-123]